MNNLFSESLLLVNSYLQQFAVSISFWPDFELAFGTNFNRAAAEIVRQRLANGSFSLPIRVLPDQVLGIALGAFAAETNTIYLRESLVSSGDLNHISEVIIEEFGHSIDAQVNQVETPGDEGAIFRLLVKGIKLTAQMLANLRAEDDWGTIVVNGQKLLVEMDTTPTEGDDTLIGSINDDTINGLGGNDTIDGNGGNDDLEGGDGVDSLDGGDGDDTLLGSKRFFSVNTSIGDTLIGGQGDDYLHGGIGSNVDGGFGTDQLFLEYDNQSGNTANITLDSFGNGFGNDGTIIQNIEFFVFRGSLGNDFIDASATNYDQYLDGNGGNDTLLSGSGNDNLNGVAGMDSLNSGSGDDYLYGGIGSNIDGGSGTDYLYLEYFGSFGQFKNTANITLDSSGSSFGSDSTIIQNIEYFVFEGSNGNDFIDVSATNYDQGLQGNGGNDTLLSGSGNDHLSGGDGNDTLTGAGTSNLNLGVSEIDFLTGGSGVDLFILGDNAYYDDHNTSTIGDNGYVTITDFDPDQDQLQLQGLASNYLLQVVGTNTNLYIEKAGSEPDELIGVLENTTGLNLTSKAFQYIKPVRNDFNNDRKADILWHNTSIGQAYIYQMNGLVVAAEGAVRTLSLDWQIAGTGDFNSNRKSDILWRNQTTGETYIYQMDGSTVANEGSVRTLSLDWQVAGTGDFNGDSKSDILWRNQVTGEAYIYQMDGSTIVDERSVRTVSPDWKISGTGDFNGDGNSDILWRNSNSGETYIYQMNGFNIASEKSIRTVDTNFEIEGVDDFDADSKSDILWRNSVTGQAYIYLMDGLTISSEGLIGEPYTSSDHQQSYWSIAGTGDYNGDFKADILWRHTDGTAYVWNMNGLALIGEGAVRQVDNNWQIASPTV
jgi:Ca2+-binding RTX toxin-like protein